MFDVLRRKKMVPELDHSTDPLAKIAGVLSVIPPKTSVRFEEHARQKKKSMRSSL